MFDLVKIISKSLIKRQYTEDQVRQDELKKSRYKF
jgi:hypothetical protein